MLEKKEKLIQPINKLRWKNDRSNEYFEAMNALPCDALTNLHDVDLLADELVSSITTQAKSIGMISKINKKTGQSKPWYDSECVSLKKSLIILLKKCKYEKFLNDKTTIEYTNTKEMYHNTKKLKRESYKDSILNQLSQCKDSKTFWNVINGFRRKHNNIKNNIDLKV